MAGDSRKARIPWQHVAILVSTGFLVSSCSSLHVPLNAPLFGSEDLLHASNSGIDLAAKPIEGTASYWQLFDDNLPEIGIGAVWVVIHSNRDDAIDLTKAKWSIKIGELVHTPLSTSEILKLYYKGRKIRMYTLKADETARRNLDNLEFHPGGKSSSLMHDGFVFFRIAPTQVPDWTRGGILRLEDIRLINGQKITIELPLSYANP
jgi:hypothetical protein